MTTIAAKRGRHRTSVLRAADTSRLTSGRYRLLVQATRADGTASRISVLYLWVLAPARR